MLSWDFKKANIRKMHNYLDNQVIHFMGLTYKTTRKK